MWTYSNPYFSYTITPGFFWSWLVITVLGIIGLWRIFEKAGKPGWAAIIPVYSLIVFLQIVGKPIWWVIWLFIPCLNVIFILIGWVWLSNLLAKSFGQGVGFTLGLMFLSFVFYPLLGFGDYAYVGPGGMPVNFGSGDYEKPFNIND